MVRPRVKLSARQVSIIRGGDLDEDEDVICTCLDFLTFLVLLGGGLLDCSALRGDIFLGKRIELRKETLPIFFLESELSSLFTASYKGKENEVNIMKSTDEEPFQIGTFREILAEGNEGLYPTDNLIENLNNTLVLLTQSYKMYLPQTNNQLKTSSNTRNQATIQDSRVVVHNVQGRQNRGQGNNAWGADKMLLMQAQENRVALDEEQSLFIVGGQDNVVDEDVDE
nr:hypothetical protein [Tanacetum cinerariifolium]